MTSLTMTSWRAGLQTVSLIAAVQRYSGLPLGRAKSEVERFLAGEAVSLQFPSERSKHEFRAAAEALGVTLVEGG